MTDAVASLGMYDSAALRAPNDSLWAAIAHRLRAGGVGHVPDALDRSRSLEAIWGDPALLLAQTCGYPLVTQWRGRLRYVATPRYRAPGCEGTSHRSRIVVRKDDPSDTLHDYRGRTAAANDLLSNTGMNLLRSLIAPLARDGGFFGSVLETGSHAASAQRVADGDADIAAIDTVTFAHLEREQPKLVRALRTLGWSASTPSLPFVTSALSSDRLVRQLRRAIGQAIEDERTAADALLLDGVEAIGVRRYEGIRTLERRAAELGYTRLN